MFGHWIPFRQVERLLFAALVLAFLAPIWANEYFLTGDGPCHLYNAKVLLDFFTSHNVDFYSDYYLLNQNTEPNWFSHIALAFLLNFFPGQVAEKVFLTVYVLSFAFILRALIKSIDPENTFLVLVGLPFMMHHTFQMGFYNYSFGFVFFFLSLWYWIRNSGRFTFAKLAVFPVLNLLLYFTHPIGFGLAALCIGLLKAAQMVPAIANVRRSWGTALKDHGRDLGAATVGFLPGIGLMIGYLVRKGLNPKANPDSSKGLYHDFLELTSLVNLSHREEMPAIALSVLMALLLLCGILYKVRTRTFNRFDSFFIVFVIMLYAYFNQPAEMAGAGILSIRLQFIPHLVLVLWFAGIRFSPNIRKGVSVAAFAISILLIGIRYAHHALASQAVEEYVSVGKDIQDRSTVLALSYSHNGKTPEGALVADRIWLFKHAIDHIGTDKSLVIFGNYEANTGYFPIIWKEGMNPFVHIATNEGIEHLPPSADILGYGLRTGGEIDHVITWCLDDQFADHPNTQDLLSQLSREYELVQVSENGLAKLYSRTDRVDVSPVQP